MQFEGGRETQVVYDTYNFGITVPEYNLKLFQSGDSLNHCIASFCQIRLHVFSAVHLHEGVAAAELQLTFVA